MSAAWQISEGAEDLRRYLIPNGMKPADCRPFDALQVKWNDAWGIGMASPLPTEDALADFYAQNYRKVMNKAHSFEAYFASPNYRAQVRSQVSWLEPVLGPHGRWLDVGAGFGLLPWQASEAKPDWQFYALEPDNDAQAHLAKVASISRDFSGFWKGHAYDGGYFDIISLSHVLEHLRDPWAALATLRNYLAPGGYLLIEVPNDPREELMRLERGSDLPHLWFFSERGLSKLLRNAGFDVVRSAVVGLKRAGSKQGLPKRARRAAMRRLKGPLSIIDDPDWYGEAGNRCDLRIVCRKQNRGPMN